VTRPRKVNFDGGVADCPLGETCEPVTKEMSSAACRIGECRNNFDVVSADFSRPKIDEMHRTLIASEMT
jgi:hypothetical protein